MVKVLTYGTYDLLHHGHVRLLERAKALGDYLIVGITADDFDRSRGKINVQQSLAERIEAVRALGIADEIIIEEYEGQKIDDVCRMGIDIFTVGSDWEGKFDYLKEYCSVVYLPRTEGVSSSEIRDKQQVVRLGLVGDSSFISKFERESHYVNGIHVVGICTNKILNMSDAVQKLDLVTSEYSVLLDKVDAVYVHSRPEYHYEQVKEAILRKKNVLCESPLALDENQAIELLQLAEANDVLLQECIKTAYATAYARMLLLLKSGMIGKVVSIDATCTSLKTETDAEGWNSIYSWGPTALLPIFQILGTEYVKKNIVTSRVSCKDDLFTKIDFVFSEAVASLKVGKGVKSEGELVISGTKGYIYVPAPWWKIDYFEMRYENQENNRRYFYQLDGDGIRHEIVAFVHSIRNRKKSLYIDQSITKGISKIMRCYNEDDVMNIILS